MKLKSPVQLSLFRRYFLTGLAFLAPLALTVFVLVYLFQLVHNSIGKPIDKFISEFVGRPIIGVGFLVALLVVLVVGIVASTVIGRRLFAFGERLLMRVPLIRTLYPPAKQVVEFFVKPTAVQFGAVVLVRNPVVSNSYAIGFITGQNVDVIITATGKKLVNVFVPFTPTPITGILLLVPEEELITVDLTVEEALKMVVSGGVVVPVSQAMLLHQSAEQT